MINICKNNNLSILNGRYGHDKDVGAMTFRETSLIDYALVSGKTFNVLFDFQITEVDRLFSDGHTLLTLDVKTNTQNKRDKPERPTRNSTTYINLSEYEQFINSLDQSKVEHIADMLRSNSCLLNPDKEIVNNIASEIRSLFETSAEKIKIQELNRSLQQLKIIDHSSVITVKTQGKNII